MSRAGSFQRGRARRSATREVPHRWVTDTGEVEAVARAAVEEGRWALDTEFHRERTYWPRLALIQCAVADEVVLIDPFEVDLTALTPALESDAECVMHAADQDLLVLERACGVRPRRLWDTQVAEGFLGSASISLAGLVRRHVGVDLPKGDRLTDWVRRPLDDAQRSYAAADVVHLLGVAADQQAALARRGRLEWVRAECELVRTRSQVVDPAEAWTRIKEARRLGGRARAVAAAVAAWREETAARLDRPARHVLSDLAVVAIAQNPPRDADQLRRTRGVGGRGVGRDLVDGLLAAVAAGLAGPVPAAAGRRGGGPARAAVSLISAWVAQLARDEDLDPAVVATRADIEELLTSGTGRLAEGWRAQLVGQPVRDLLAGRAAVAFEGDRLVIEPREHDSHGSGGDPESGR